MFNNKKNVTILLIFILLMFFCMSCVRKKPMNHPNPRKNCGFGMVWVPGHHSPAGNWIPGHCAHK